MKLIVPAVLLALALFWIVQLRNVVMMRDEEFDGRNDKLIWFLIVFWGFAPGALAFLIWKNMHELEKQTERKLNQALDDAAKK